MTQIFEEFNVLKKLNKEFKENIKLFHIFNNSNSKLNYFWEGYNVL